MIYDKPSNPGDLKAFVIKIDGQDVSEAVTGAEIYQDIFNPTWSAQVFFDDTTNLLTRLQIKAGKKITIKVATEFGGMAGDGEKEFELVVYKIGNKVRVNHMQQQYTLFAAHQAFFKDQSKRVQRSYVNQPAHSIASSIISQELGGTAVTHPSDNSISVVIPNWSPFHACAWLCKVGLSKKAADYCIFQVDNNQFAFKSFETMYSSDEEKADVTFVSRPEGMRTKGEYSDDFTLHVQQYAWQHFDGAAEAASGLYKNKTVSFDIINKKWDTKTFTYGDDTPADAKGKNFEDGMVSEDANISFVMKHPGMFDAGKSTLDFADDWSGSRKSSLQKMDRERLVIQIPGAVKAWEWVGKNVMVDLPSEQDMEKEKLDKLRKGRYVVIAICHNVQKSGYSVNIELVKKRMEK